MTRSISLPRQMGILIAAVAVWAAFRTPLGKGMLLVAAAALALALFRPRVFSSLTSAWMKLAEVLARVVGPVAMFVIYVVVIVPVGLVRRAMGADPLGLRRDRAATSYWRAAPRDDADFNTMF